MKVIVAGGGIGGLAAALALQARGIDVSVFERAERLEELGVGINVLPHAIGVLAGLGLLPALDAVAVRTRELVYANRQGQAIWREPRGIAAGHAFPQLSIHRGRLHGVLLAAVRERLGEPVHTGHRIERFVDGADDVEATFRRPDGSAVTCRADVLIAADGIHSAVRAQLYPDEGAPLWNGAMLWRGALPRPGERTPGAMIIAGGMRAKLVLYPIAPPDADGRILLNWAVMARVAERGGPPPRREDWNRKGRLDELMAHVSGFRLEGVDLAAIIAETPAFYEYPLCDRDPVDRWSFGRVTLLGDAAHPMYPVGSNGASQAILDAQALAEHLGGGADPVAALRAYEADRAPATAAIVRSNRAGGPEQVIDLVESRAPDGFAHLDDVATQAELRAIVGTYSATAGFARPPR